SRSGLLEVTRGGKTVFSSGLSDAFEAYRLPSGRILCATGAGVVELDSGGKELRRLTVGSTRRVEPIAGGRFLVVTSDTGHVREVDAGGKVLWEARLAPGVVSAHRVSGGNVLAASDGEKLVVEIDRSGKEVWRTRTTGRPFRARRY